MVRSRAGEKSTDGYEEEKKRRNKNRPSDGQVIPQRQRNNTRQITQPFLGSGTVKMQTDFLFGIAIRRDERQRLAGRRSGRGSMA